MLKVGDRVLQPAHRWGRERHGVVVAVARKYATVQWEDANFTEKFDKVTGEGQGVNAASNGHYVLTPEQYEEQTRRRELGNRLRKHQYSIYQLSSDQLARILAIVEETE